MMSSNTTAFAEGGEATLDGALLALLALDETKSKDCPRGFLGKVVRFPEDLLGQV